MTKDDKGSGWNDVMARNDLRMMEQLLNNTGMLG